MTGFTLAIALLFFAGVNATRYLITRLTAPPPKPIFPNDTPTPVANSPTPGLSPRSANSSATTQAGTSASTTSASPSPSPSVSPSPSPSDQEGYEARVTEPIGLVIRSDPSQDADRVGGVEYEQELTVLETSSDGEWLRVRLSGSDTEGWVKAGNVEKVN
ncbi:MAG TPA: SH3 domain-containing protein [Crinalium sp.]